MKKIYDAAIKDLMKILVPDHAPKAPEASHGVQIHIHGGAAVTDKDRDSDPSADDLGLPPLGEDKHKSEMAALHAKGKGK